MQNIDKLECKQNRSRVDSSTAKLGCNHVKIEQKWRLRTLRPVEELINGTHEDLDGHGLSTLDWMKYLQIAVCSIFIVCLLDLCFPWFYSSIYRKRPMYTAILPPILKR